MTSAALPATIQPAGEPSKTQRLVEAACAELQGRGAIVELLDLSRVTAEYGRAMRSTRREWSPAVRSGAARARTRVPAAQPAPNDRPSRKLPILGGETIGGQGRGQRSMSLDQLLVATLLVSGGLVVAVLLARMMRRIAPSSATSRGSSSRWRACVGAG